MTLTDVLLNQLLNGIVLGSFYALVALGYTMVFGVVKLLNFAHGELYMVGGFAGFLVLSFLAPFIGAGWFGVAVSMVLAMIAVGFLGVIIERVAYAPMLSAPRLSILITALAVSLVLQNGMLTLTKGQYVPFGSALGFGGVNLGKLFISYNQMILVGVAAALMLGLELFVSRTQYGRAMRAVSVDKDMSRLMGINVNRVIAVTFFLGSGLAAAAGTMAGAFYGSLWYFMGFLIGLKAFTAAVLGGIGSIPGAMLGGLVLGVAEAFGADIFGDQYKDVVAFGLLVLVLLFRPTGILGRPEVEKV